MSSHLSAHRPRLLPSLALLALLAVVGGACTGGEEATDDPGGAPAEEVEDTSEELDDPAAGDGGDDLAAEVEEGGDAAPGAGTDAVRPLAAGSGAGAANDGAAPAGLTVTGSGVASGEPDVVRLTAGVEVERDDVEEALDAANAATEEVLDALEASGVGAEDRQTRDFAIHPRMDREGGIEGYAVRNLVEATIRDVGSVGTVVRDTSEAAGDDVRIQGLRFDLEQDTAMLEAARAAAIEDARQRAEHYAELADRTLGDLVALEDRTTASPRAAVEQDVAAEEGADAGVPIEPGEQHVTVHVQARWELD